MAEITASLRLRYLKDGEPVDTEWVWVSDTPYLVTVVFTDGQRRVPWDFARELLAEGLRDEAGIADVQIRRHGSTEVTIRLHSPAGCATYVARRKPLVKFLAQTMGRVPRSRESVDVDSALVKLLADSS